MVVDFRFEQITLYNVNISAVTDQPTKAIVEISGKVSAYVDGVYTTKDFYRKTVVKFLYRLWKRVGALWRGAESDRSEVKIAVPWRTVADSGFY